MSIFGNLPPEDDRIRPEIKALIARGNVTAAELAELRMNSWERDALVPAMTDEALIERLEYALANCFTGARPFSTYNQAVEGLYAPELIKRFKSVTDAFRDLEEAITVDRAATGRNSEAWDALQKIRTPPATAGDAEALSAGDPGVAGGDSSRPHIVDGEFQSDKYPTTPRGKVPLSTKDPMAQDLLWTYAQRRRSVDSAFSADLEFALRGKGFNPNAQQPTFTYSETIQMLKNVGYDPECGACAAIAFTGVGFPSDKHTCKKTPPVMAGDPVAPDAFLGAGVAGGDSRPQDDFEPARGGFADFGAPKKK